MDSRKLARIHRVRTLQLGLARADESRAQAQVASESALASRIAQLADGIAPAPDAAHALSFAAAAYYRERLHRSAETAQNRLRSAEADAERAADAARAAHRDQSAVEKLIARANLDASRAELRAMQDAPPTHKKRHDPC